MPEWRMEEAWTRGLASGGMGQSGFMFPFSPFFSFSFSFFIFFILVSYIIKYQIYIYCVIRVNYFEPSGHRY